MIDSSKNSGEFAADLKRRNEAAKDLEEDLLAEVPLLYGSPGPLEPYGDPGVLIAQMHREDMYRRHGGGAPSSPRRREGVSLPFERTTVALALLIALLFFFLD